MADQSRIYTADGPSYVRVNGSVKSAKRDCRRYRYRKEGSRSLERVLRRREKKAVDYSTDEWAGVGLFD